MHLIRLTGLAMLATSFHLPPVSGQSVPPGLLTSSNETGFGTTVTATESEIFVGEPLTLSRGGVLYIYRHDGSGNWSEAQRITPSDGTAGDRFGRAIAVSGDILAVGATNIDNGTGAVYLFSRLEDGTWGDETKLVARDGFPGDANGRAVAIVDGLVLSGAGSYHGQTGIVYVFGNTPDGWQQVGTVTPQDQAQGDLFGLSMAAHAHRLAVSAVGADGRKGVVYLFRHGEDNTWTEEARLSVENLPSQTNFGAGLALDGDRLLVGAPTVDRARGAVFSFTREAGAWVQSGRIDTPDTNRIQIFGVSIGLTGDETWIGAPQTGRMGTVHAYRWDGTGWTYDRSVTAAEVGTGDQFGGAISIAGDVAAIGMAGDDYGEGSVIVLERENDSWKPRGRVFSEVPGHEIISGGEVKCEEGKAREFGCNNVDIISFLPLKALDAARGVRLNDVWGWTDPATGTEYALVGTMEATVFVSLADPRNPIYLGSLPRTEGAPGSTWRDIKVYKNHAFIVSDGAGEHGMQVFDLTQLRNVTNPPMTFHESAHYSGINSAHNIVIDEETGYAFAVGASGGAETCGGGLHMINIQDPAQPTFAGCFADPSTGRRRTGYTHDAQCVVYRGPDEEHRGREICIGANETALNIADVTDKNNPVTISTANYPNVGYAHQGWMSADQKYFFSDDELDEVNGLVSNTRTLIWDITDLDDPVLIREHYAETQSTDHNLYVNGKYMYQTNNTAGLRILDVSNPEVPVEIAYFDPIPQDHDVAGFDGTWSSYPFFKSGLIVVSARREGLFIVKRRDVTPVP